MENENNAISNETNVDVVDENNKKEIDNQEFCNDIENPEEIKPAKKKKTKKILCIVFTCVLIVGLIVTYLKLNENVFKVQNMIDNIGEITLDSEKVIQETEDAFNALSDSEKKRVKNKNILEESKEQYSNLLIESFEDSSLYNQMKSIVNSNMALYNPKMTFNKSEKEVEKIELTFSEFYQSATYFEEAKDLLNDYFNVLNTSLHKSDKKHLNTFILPNEYEGINNELSYYSRQHLSGSITSKSDMDKTYLNAKLFLPYLDAEKRMAELELLLAVDDNTVNEEWFIEFEKFITDTCNEYANFDNE